MRPLSKEIERAPVEIVSVAGGDPAFWKEHEREALSKLYNFLVVWHEQVYEFRALEGEQIAGGLRCTIAASLMHITGLIVAPGRRRRGIGRELLERAEEAARYYNCHKISLIVPALGEARAFEACGYNVEAILPQHAFKIDAAVLRKFIL